jgi:hypothetical protein
VQIVEFLNVKADGVHSYHCFYSVNGTICDEMVQRSMNYNLKEWGQSMFSEISGRVCRRQKQNFGDFCLPISDTV